MASTKQPLKLIEESWGDRLHRAYRMARETHGLTYRSVAGKVSQLMPISDSTITRWELLD